MSLVIAVLTTVLVAEPLPDSIDNLRSAQIVPNVGLLLDASCSMRYNPQIPTECSWWANQYNGGDRTFTKNEVMRSVLVGCESPSDGILDRWADRANFSVFQFGHRSGSAELVAPFDSSLSRLETAVMNVPASSNTPMSRALRDHAQYFQGYFEEAATQECRPNFLLLLSDGNPNGSAATYNFNCPRPGDPTASTTVSAYQPWRGAEYLTEHQDFLCAVDGEQDIKTHTIGFGAPGSFSPSNLQRIAQDGEGQYFYASDLAQLDTAFEQIIGAMTSRAGLFYSSPAVQLDGLFSDNLVYAAIFQPQNEGRWAGTVKKHCIEPPRTAGGLYDIADRRCIFFSGPDGKTLYTNPDAVDLWTNNSELGATTGGAGAVLLDRLGTPGGVPNRNLYPRNIVTWRAGGSNYIRVRHNTITSAESETTPTEHKKLVNLLHGYTYDAASNGNPVAVATWPLGDPVHSPTALIRYGEDCSEARQCFVIVGMNDGMLHFFDASSGEETTALIPAELWSSNTVANFQLKDIISQPATDVIHRYFVDGGLSVFHDDGDGDGIVDNGETAYLIFGLGRGGAAYYQIPMGRFSGTLSAVDNPVHPLPQTPGTAFAELRDTWAAPWSGRHEHDGATLNVAAFASGHIREFDDKTHATPSTVAGGGPSVVSRAETNCTSFMRDNGYDTRDCRFFNRNGYWDQAPLDRTYGPYQVSDGIAYRVRFRDTDLTAGGGDRLELRDGQGRVVQTFTGGRNQFWSDWVFADRFELRLVTDGLRSRRNRGFRIQKIEYRTQSVGQSSTHNPTVFVVDLDKWNGAEPRPFAGTAQAGGVLTRIASACPTVGGDCVDARAFPDLANMVCPISGEISAYTEAGLLKALYWGDECGQIWKAWHTLRGENTIWQAKRLLSVNEAPRLRQSTNSGQSKNFRKIQRKLDLVQTGCPGHRAIGIYFGTGNVQRPTARDELEDSDLGSGRDVIGVVWDFEAAPANLRLRDLVNVSGVASIDSTTLTSESRYGWFIELDEDERMLRDPLVFEGVAYFKTYQPTEDATECSPSAGRDRIYAMNNCSAAAARDADEDGEEETEDRIAWSGNVDIGGNLFVATPQNGATLVSHANLNESEEATLLDTERRPVPRIFQWREPSE